MKPWTAVYSVGVLFMATGWLVIWKLFALNSTRPKPDPKPRPAELVGARLAIVSRRSFEVAPDYGPGYLADVLAVSYSEPAVVTGYGDGCRRRLHVRTFPAGTYYAIEYPGKPVVEIFIANAGDRVPVRAGSFLGERL